MLNPMDSASYNNVMSPNAPQNIEQLVQQIKQNPQAFEEYVRNNNPQAYQMALNIRNAQNPQAIIMQMLQTKGINPNILSMFGIK